MFRLKGKLLLRFIGPFEIVQKVGKVAYRIALLSHLARVHDVFHVFMRCNKEQDSHHIAEWNQFDLRQDIT
ncbi:hypothetical protein Scep_028047 [Stephania cephalantha]|uniref:Tf2-1-like SH3-like domain-containing protein n=1 Tax=Stephania cephalantha TaxID=152367 RepID=A0AAP0HN41_9MAGN